jgi:signal transduction histidine kinase
VNHNSLRRTTERHAGLPSKCGSEAGDGALRALDPGAAGRRILGDLAPVETYRPGMRSQLGLHSKWHGSSAGAATATAPCPARIDPAGQEQPPADNAALHCANDRLEAEIKRIACALHDESGQILTLAHLKLAEVRRLAPAGCATQLDQVTMLLSDLEAHLRRLSHELRPPILDDFGLTPAVEFLAESFSQSRGIAVAVMGGAGGRLDPRIEVAFYRAVQEALTNVAKHARATRATIRLQRLAQSVVCVIRDNGRGFDVSAKRPPGLGFLGMRERAEALGGYVAIDSHPGAGTELTIRIPVPAMYERA